MSGYKYTNDLERKFEMFAHCCKRMIFKLRRFLLECGFFTYRISKVK